jgi:hypothetical protein
VHRWSDHPEVVKLVEGIWTGNALDSLISKKGPKPKRAFREQLRVLILDLYVAWLQDPDLSVGVSMDSNAWKTGSRYNALHISKKIRDIINVLVDVGLIIMNPGSYSVPGAKTNRTARIRASRGLQQQFAEAKFQYDDISHAEGTEIIVFKDEEGRQIEYKDTPKTNQMRADLKAYNDLIADTFIDIGGLPHPEIPTNHNGKQVNQRIDGPAPLTRRIFSRENWDMHGRFYGGWWQRFNSDFRSTILLDDQPTVEVDYKGLHIAILAAEQGRELSGDPYQVSADIFPDLNRKLVRKMVKRLVLIGMNAKDKSSAYKSFRTGGSSDFEKHAENTIIDQLLEGFLTANPTMRSFLFTDQGIRLMNIDGQITSWIHNHFTKQGIPVLSVHDSYIIDCRKVGELRQAMADASEAIVGRPLATSVSFPDIEEYTDLSDAEIAVHIENKSSPRRDPYVQRLLDHEKRTDRVISPYDRGLEGYLEDDYPLLDDESEWE